MDNYIKSCGSTHLSDIHFIGLFMLDIVEEHQKLACNFKVVLL